MPAEPMIFGQWWKYDRYEIREGFICPVPGATLQSYDPWQTYADSQRTTRKEPPYQSLLRLLSVLGGEQSDQSPLCAQAILSDAEGLREDLVLALDESDHVNEVDVDFILAEFWRDRYEAGDIDFDFVMDRIGRVIPRAGVGLLPLEAFGVYVEPGPADLAKLRRLCPLPPRWEQSISEWCSEHGLLGILPHIAESVVMAARWVRHRGPSMRASATEHYRSNGKWSTRQVWCSFFEGVDLGTPVMGALLPISPGYSPRCPGARVRHIEKYGREDRGLSEETLFESWCDFFPTVLEDRQATYEYPRPLTDEFWRLYAEPVEVFLRYALILKQAVKSELSTLETLLEPIGVALNHNCEGRAMEQWRCPSLLSAFAKMAIQDLAGGSSVLRCPSCGLPFGSSAYQAVYCSPQCAWRYRKHRARSAKRIRRGWFLPPPSR